MVGCGLIVPLAAFYLVSGQLLLFPWKILLAYALVQLASALLTALPDFEADREIPKRTLVVITRSPQIVAGLIILLGSVALALADGHDEVVLNNLKYVSGTCFLTLWFLVPKLRERQILLLFCFAAFLAIALYTLAFSRW